MDTSLGEQGYKRMSWNHTWCSLAVKMPQTWTIPIFKTSQIDSNSLTAIGEILQNPEWFALPQQSIQADLCTSKNTKNRKSLSARSNLACSQLDQCSGSRKRHFCVLCCWGGSEYTVRETFILTFVSLTLHWQVTWSRSALCSGEMEVKMCGLRGVVTIHLAAYFSILWLVSGLCGKT